MFLALACARNEQALVSDADPSAQEVPRNDVGGVAPEDVVPVADEPEIEPGDTGEPGDEDDDELLGSDPGEASFLFDEGSVHDFWIELDDEAQDSLSADPFTEVRAMFVYEGDPWEVGLRLKGSNSFRTLDGKPSFKVDFHEWHEYARFFGKKRLTLNNMIQDRTLLREHTYYWIAAQVGIPAPRHGYARVYVNGDYYGLYGIVESMDEQFIDRVWPEDDEGSLWESSGADVTWDHDWFDLDEEGIGEVEDLVEVVEDTDPDDWLDMLDEHFHDGSLFRYWALDVLAGNPDGYIYNRHNYHLYYAPIADRWFLVPWGTDRSFTREGAPVHGSETQPIRGALVAGCLDDGDCRDRFDEAVLDMADAWDALDVYAFVEAAEAAIREAAEEDPRREDGWDPDDIEEFVREAAEGVRRQLGD
ncbi:MAG: CotH kinase family protein [Myxococcota bacterium]